MRALGVIAKVHPAGMMPAFSGGTSLSKGWELIKRFSEDIDFKVGEPAASSASRARRERTAYRECVLEAFAASDFEIIGEPDAGNASRFFSADVAYGAQFAGGQRLRPHIRIEMSSRAPALAPAARPIRSLIAAAQRQRAEVASFPCVDPVETAADKLSALAWRVRARDRSRPDDDPTIVRHLHDLAALEPAVSSAASFREQVVAAVAADEGRTPRRCLPRCCASSRPMCSGQGNMRISCGQSRLLGQARGLPLAMRLPHAIGSSRLCKIHHDGGNRSRQSSLLDVV